MKAIVQESYGKWDTLKIDEIPIPIPKENEVLVAVKGVSLNAPDWRLLQGKPFVVRVFSGWIKPKARVKGTDFSGIITVTGSSVKSFKAGDQVYGDLSSCGFGAFAEYVCIDEGLLAKMPSNLSYANAASLPLTSVTALQAVRNLAKVKEGDRVLIVGASGGVGSFIIQHCRNLKAHITAVVSTKRIPQAIRLGADDVIDYLTEDLAQATTKYDVILYVNGSYPISIFHRLLSSKGRFVLVGSSNLKHILYLSIFGKSLSKKYDKSYQVLMAKPNAGDLSYITEVVEQEKLTPVIDRQIEFSQIPFWIGELEKGHIGGKIIVDLDGQK
ncbi:MAG: hypothetical protein BGO41_10800 [Clostridiales bacterium 38-18]|nr:MAG: hypothetical protein BGO41_10800 [Clostridiales bacterium 38-18]